MENKLDTSEELKVFLNLDITNKESITDEDAADILLSKFLPIKKSIGRRLKKVKTIGITYDVPSVLIHDQARDLYCLGYFYSAIIVCRSAAEHFSL